ncbi:MAG: aldolase/citrate lyase family protein [Anaerolineae bacterium]|jgi:4-hydroxy-2-oxoheptanedioate aldolase|nr:aldolase/citrate lyase family protein [Anaerolineae bacterium]
MFENRCKNKIEARQPAIGSWLMFPSPDLVEFMGHLGFDYFIIDAEHGAYSPETTQSLVRAAEPSGITPIVRVSKNDQPHILSYLETGVLGIMVPHTNTVEDARAIVRAVKYPPLGRRSAGSTTRAANFGLTQRPAQYFEESNRRTLVIPLIEEPEGFENLAGIMAVEGVDWVDLGPGDLSLSLGVPGQPGHHRVRAMLDAGWAQLRAAGKVLGATVSTVEEARHAIADGVLWIDFDIQVVLTRAIRDFLAQVAC